MPSGGSLISLWVSYATFRSVRRLLAGMRLSLERQLRSPTDHQRRIDVGMISITTSNAHEAPSPPEGRRADLGAAICASE
jgi:hypothetical protein